MYATRHTLSVTTASDGSATVYSELPANGRVLSIQYVKPGAGGFDNGSTMTFTGETTGVAIWTESNVNASAERRPRAATHSTAGAAALYAAGGAAVNDHIVLAGERVKCVIASGGNAKTATFYVTVG
jgi:hypothetical protein